MYNTNEKGNSATDVLGSLVKKLKTMWTVIVLLIVLLVGTNMTWLYVFQIHDCQYNQDIGVNANSGIENKSEEERKVEGN